MSKTNPTILLIEDDQALTEMYMARFKEEGLTLLAAKDGEEGLEMARAGQPDVILLDIMMPKLDGFAVIKRLKEDEATKKIPVIMLSNLGQKSDIEKGRELGAEDYIVKATLTPTQMLEKAKKFINK